MWQCKRHGKGCNSYVKGFVHDLNISGIQPHEAEKLDKESKKFLELVKWVEERLQKKVRVKQ